jgi:hypothetical protein
MRKLEEIEELSRQNETRILNAAINKINKGYQPKEVGCKDKKGEIIGEQEKILQRWSENFHEQLNDTDAERLSEEEIEKTDNKNGWNNNINILEDIPTQEEIDNTTKKLRNNRSPGEDIIISEMIKYSGPSMRNEIYKLITQTWNEEKIPDNWNIDIICLIYKKGDKTEC